MKKAIALLGPPASGKSTLAKPYSKRLIQIGEYAHSLPDNHSIKQRCMEHWRDNTVFDPELLKDILQRYPLEQQDWYIFDGTPRDVVCIPVIERLFQLTALVEIAVNEDIWLERASKSANNGRRVRHDSSLPQLLKRKEVYEQKMQGLRPYFNRQYKIDNSGDLEVTRDQFARIIGEVFN